jgi:hypothetical protein
MKPLARMAWILAGLVVVAVLALYGIENLRGRIALEEAYAEVMSAKSAHVDADRDDPYPAAEENFFGTPLLAGFTDFTIDPDPSKGLWDRVHLRDKKSVQKAQSVSLPRAEIGKYGHLPRYIGLDAVDGTDPGLEAEMEVWAAIFRSSREFDVSDPGAPAARQVLMSIENRFGSELKELADAGNRRASALPRHTISGSGLLPDLGAFVSMEMTGLKGLLTLRMAAAIADNDCARFHESCLILLRLLEGLHPGESGDDLLFLNSEISSLLKLISLGIRRDLWKRDDLELLHGRLSGLNLPERIEKAFFASVDFRKAYFAEIRRHPGVLAKGYPSVFEVPFQFRVVQLGPRGWIDLNAAEAIRWTQSVGIQPWSKRDFRSLPSLSAKLPDFGLPGTFMLRANLFPQEGFSQRLTGLMVDWELTRHACLLEIHHIDTGAYPDTLGAVADPIPLDPFTQKELVYRNDGERFLLYSVGWNLHDDLGAVARERRNRLDRLHGDWVWGEEDLLDATQNERRKRALAWIAMERELGRPVSESEFQAAHPAASFGKDSPDRKKAREAELIRQARERIARDREAMGK